jgi:hypothetical protein
LEEDLQKNTVNLLWANKITHVGSKQPFFVLGENSPKGDTAKLFGQNPFFFLKSICQVRLCPLFKERVHTRTPTGYTSNAPREKYRQLVSRIMTESVWGYLPVL